MKHRFTLRNVSLVAMVAIGLALAFAGYLPSMGGAEIGLPLMGFGLATAPYPVNPTLTAIAMAYRNTEADLIADEILPRIDTGSKFTWIKYGVAQGYTIPDTQVGRKGKLNEVDFNGTEVQDATLDFGLIHAIPYADMLEYEAMPKPASGGPMHPREIATMFLTHLVQLAREVRVASLVFDAAQYAAANKATLSGTSQWSDYTNSNPVAAINDALDVPLIRPDTLTIGRLAWTKLRQHPRMVEAVKGTGAGLGAQGMVSRQQVADLFELRQVLVGGSQYNTAKPGQTPTYARAWGKHALLSYSSRMSAEMRQPTLGFTAQFGPKVAGSKIDDTIGLRGGESVRVGEGVKEVLCAPDVAYLFTNATA